MKKFILNKEAMNVNPAYNTWAVMLHDKPVENSTGLWVFLKTLDSEMLIDESVVCPEGWYFVELDSRKGFYKKNYQGILVDSEG